MNSIKNGIFLSSTFLVLALSGCASQDEIIPSTGPEMKDIYRGALGSGATSEFVHVSEAEALCAELDLEESKEDCVRKAGEILDATRLRLDTNPGNETLDYEPYTRTAINEIDNLFPRLPNPDLVIYVYPHLATSVRAPIPGYSTVIPLYDRVQYRMPGESLGEQ